MIEYTQTELRIMGIFSAIGAVFSFLVGGMDAPIKALLVLICVDYGTGMVAAWKTGTLSSQRGFNGLGRKITILAVVAFANMLDVSMGLQHIFRSMAIFGYAGMEGMSICENIDRAGYGEYIPQFIRDKLIQLREEKGVKI
ncbi:holin tox secr: toxin secretion/phage lysis holin [Lucifera butyrica]|uniref:Holin tox secr: toxin secretion/phage lysis holin n=1 Tax=Lucifera butyrica TaxID=1351585 RepID=A0A498R3Y4_9FIRM|nr:phage holin family protein [Lucifera butyrica]VBB05557.1 holin tox secr: toxin secretion/phage lysis holin [Lucifera butyrica]